MLVCKEPQSYTLLRKEKHVLIYTRQQTHIASETRNFPFTATDLPSIPTGSVFKRYIYIYSTEDVHDTICIFYMQLEHPEKHLIQTTQMLQKREISLAYGNINSCKKRKLFSETELQKPEISPRNR